MTVDPLPVVTETPAAAELTPVATEKRLAGTVAVSWELLVKVVASAVPFHCTFELAVKALPFTVSVKSAPPAAIDAGLRLESTGAGAITVNVAGTGELNPLGFVTRILKLPTLAMALAGTLAVSLVKLT